MYELKIFSFEMTFELMAYHTMNATLTNKVIDMV